MAFVVLLNIKTLYSLFPNISSWLQWTVKLEMKRAIKMVFQSPPNPPMEEWSNSIRIRNCWTVATTITENIGPIQNWISSFLLLLLRKEIVTICREMNLLIALMCVSPKYPGFSVSFSVLPRHHRLDVVSFIYTWNPTSCSSAIHRHHRSPTSSSSVAQLPCTFHPSWWIGIKQYFNNFNVFCPPCHGFNEDDDDIEEEDYLNYHFHLLLVLLFWRNSLEARILKNLFSSYEFTVLTAEDVPWKQLVKWMNIDFIKC